MLNIKKKQHKQLHQGLLGVEYLLIKSRRSHDLKLHIILIRSKSGKIYLK